MGVCDQIKTAFQDIIAPELHALRGDIRLVDQKIAGLERLVDQKIAGLDQKIVGLDQKLDGVDARLNVKIDAVRSDMASLRAELVAEIRRVDTRIDGVDRELRTAIDIRERLAALEARELPDASPPERWLVNRPRARAS